MKYRAADKSKIRGVKKLPSLISIPQFAEKMNVHRVNVYMHIYNGKLPVVLIGMDETPFIDYTRHKNYKFDKSKDMYSLKK